MKQRMLSVLVLCLVLAFATATVAQTAGGGSTTTAMTAPKAVAIPFAKELCVFYGYAWTFSQSFDYYNGLNYTSGEVDIADKTIWGMSLDVPVRPGMWAELLYSNQASDLTFKSNSRGLETIGALNINYWQLGAVQAVKAGGKVVPFTSLSLGATYVTADENDVSEWYFSMILGAGAKVYMNERAGLRLQARLPISFTGGGFGAGVGTGGASVGFYGTGVTQFDLSAGAFVSF